MEFAKCVKYLRALDPSATHDVHRRVLCEMGAKSPNYLIALGAKSDSARVRMLRCIKQAGALQGPLNFSPRKVSKLRKNAPLLAALLEWVGVTDGNGYSSFPPEVRGWIRRLAAHAEAHYTAVDQLPPVELKRNEHPGLPSAVDDLRQGLVTTPALRVQEVNLHGSVFAQDIRNKGGEAGAESKSGFACHNASVTAATLTPGVCAFPFPTALARSPAC